MLYNRTLFPLFPDDLGAASRQENPVPIPLRRNNLCDLLQESPIWPWACCQARSQPGLLTKSLDRLLKIGRLPVSPQVVVLGNQFLSTTEGKTLISNKMELTTELPQFHRRRENKKRVQEEDTILKGMPDMAAAQVPVLYHQVPS